VSREGASPAYCRYRLAPRPAPDVAPHPSRFRVEVKRGKLLALVLHELFVEYRKTPAVALSRPCVYGVFDRAVGGLAPIHARCVGCLRCTTQYPEIVSIVPNPARRALGDAYLTPDTVDTLLYEARHGRVPVRGAGYRGPFGGPGWDAMWTDMSEIVRPTRDGIHGRESISTEVDLGERPTRLALDERGEPVGPLPDCRSLPVPFLFDAPPPALAPERLLRALADAAEAIGTRALLPVAEVVRLRLASVAVAPLVRPGEEPLLDRLAAAPDLVEVEAGEPAPAVELARRLPEAVVFLRVPMASDPVAHFRAGARNLHLVADYHGESGAGFALGAIRRAHAALLAARIREEVTLVGSGGIVAADHLAKAILCGLDAVALDTALWVALQARFAGEARSRASARGRLPQFPAAWGAQRLVNLANAWRDQLLEVLGAMGLREVRRLRGEMGRAMLQSELEAEAFAGIEGFPAGGAA
jgi:hypothetical protein